jgi:isocitrate/isopropylmalate dehydrogenase
MASSNYRIAVIPGDGIGMEVVPEGLKVLQALAPRFDLSFEFEHFDWSCERYLESGAMMPEIRCHLPRRGRLSDGAGSCFAVGLVDPDSA